MLYEIKDIRINQTDIKKRKKNKIKEKVKKEKRMKKKKKKGNAAYNFLAISSHKPG
jgi:hypothetical protein